MFRFFYINKIRKRWKRVVGEESSSDKGLCREQQQHNKLNMQEAAIPYNEHRRAQRCQVIAQVAQAYWSSLSRHQTQIRIIHHFLSRGIIQGRRSQSEETGLDGEDLNQKKIQEK